MERLNIFVVGLFASGKGTQSMNLAKAMNTETSGMGDLLRRKKSEEPEFEQRVSSIMLEGKGLPDEITNAVFAEYWESFPKTKDFIFDGYPRTEGQAAFVADFLESKGEKAVMISLNIDYETALRRCSTRYELAKLGYGELREDDANEDSLLERKKQHEQFPLIREVVKARSNVYVELIDIDASPDEKSVLLEMLRSLSAHRSAQ